MRFLGSNIKPRSQLPADVAEVADLRFDVEADMGRVEHFLFARKLHVIPCRYDFRIVVVGNFVSLNPYVAVRGNNVVLRVIHVLLPPLRTGRRDLDLVLLCPEKDENT